MGLNIFHTSQGFSNEDCRVKESMQKFDRLFDVAFVRPPSNDYENCVSTNPASHEIDVTLALEQHRAYTSILREAGINVVQLPPLEGFPDSVFMQDPAILGTSVSVIGRFGARSRRGEEKAFSTYLAQGRNAVGKLNFIAKPGTLEGGDIVVTNRGLFVGKSQRTNSVGIRQLSAFLPQLFITRVKTELLHLLCSCSYLSEQRMIVCPDFVDVDYFQEFELLKIPKEDVYSADALYLGERRVLIPAGFRRTASKLKEAGYRPIEVEMSEFFKGDGGVTCLSSPVYKVF